MGEVYRAHDERLGREVAVKILPAKIAGDAGRLQRFEQEARLASALNSPGILTVHDFGREGGLTYLVTELIEGESLRARLLGRHLRKLPRQVDSPEVEFSSFERFRRSRRGPMSLKSQHHRPRARAMNHLLKMGVREPAFVPRAS
jgi:serine/threonine protein kinase